MNSFKVQVIAQAWVCRHVEVAAADQQSAERRAIEAATAVPGFWHLVGDKTYLDLWMNPQELDAFGIGELAQLP